MRNYELTFIVHPELDKEGVSAAIESVKQLVLESGGQVNQVDPWGKRRLAYPIRKQREGYYVVMQVQLPPEAISELERRLELSEEVLRYLLVRTDK